MGIRELKINTDICGWGGEEILEHLASCASKVPENGIIVELGTFVGRSAYALGMNKHHSVSLYCYDKWESYHNSTNRLVRTFGKPDSLQGSLLDQTYSIETAKENLKDVKNITLIKSRLPLQHVPFEDNSVDLIYIDAGHTYNQTLYNANQWYPKMKTDGVMIFDDYSEEIFPEVYNAANDFVNRYVLKTKVVFGWQMIVTI